jgi:transposase-like protein
MPWKGVTVSEQRERFLEDYRLDYYSITELAERFGISRRTAHKWIARYRQHGQAGIQERSRRPNSCPWQTSPAVVEEFVRQRKAHPHWGPRKLLKLMHGRHGSWQLPAPSTAALILARHGLVRSRRRSRRAHPGCPKTVADGPNDIWGADYKGQFRLKNGRYCFPLTVSDLATRFVLGVDAHPAISLERAFAHFRRLFESYGLPNRIRTDNGVPFAASALGRLGGVVHQAGELPGTDRTGEAQPEWSA